MYDAYLGRRVLLTGHTGFKGGWLGLWLKILGAEVLGFSLPPEAGPGFYSAVGLGGQIRSVFGDIRDLPRLEELMRAFRPEAVFHLAAQSLVRRSCREPLLTYQTNLLGSLNLMEAARACGSVRAFVCVTTDKCYENPGNGGPGRPFREDDRLGGHDLYSSSKACLELLASSYRLSFLSGGFLLATARAGNVIGGGDRGEDRLLPDCIRAIEAAKPIRLRNPEARRPWQFVLEPLAGYLALGGKLLAGRAEYARAFNFGPDSADSVLEVARKTVEAYGKGSLEICERDPLAPHEAGCLQLDAGLAKKMLGWKLHYDLDEAVTQSVAWYKDQAEGRDLLEFSRGQIEGYMSRAAACNAPPKNVP